MSKHDVVPATDGWRTATADTDQPRFPARVATGLAIGAFCWVVAYLGSASVLLPARIAEVDPAGKAGVVALNSTVAMVVATLANVLVGACSDLTRSRWGRRTPWIWAGAAGSTVSLVVLGRVTTSTGIVVTWAVYQVFLNAMIAPLLGTLADRVSPRFRGSVASAYALGIGVGTGLGQVVGARFLDDTGTGFVVLAVLTMLAAPAASLCFREASSLPMPAKRLDTTTLLENFVVARHDCRDYYLAMLGKFLVMVAKFSVQGYLLYILTDYMSLDQGTAAGYISTSALIIMVAGIVMALVAGPLADRSGRVRLPVIVASLLVGAGVLVPAFTTDPRSIVVYAVLAGTGLGAFNAVDQALNVAVLPDPATAAKDLGILNLANTGGQVAGPLLSASVITMVGYHGVFVLAAVSALLAVVAFAAVRRVP